MAFLALPATAPAAPLPPAVLSTSLSQVQTTSARLEAQVDPEGSSTRYHFEYGEEGCATGQCAKTQTASAGSGTEAVPVSADVTGLSPGHTYDFRIVANSAGGKTPGPDRVFSTYAEPPAFGPCPNEALRSGSAEVAVPPGHPSANLPDCRAYEQVSPVQKNGLDVKGRVALVKASPDGERVSFLAGGGMLAGEGTQDYPMYLSSRGGGGWSTESVMPPESLGQEVHVLGWSAGFQQFFEAAGRFSGQGGATLLTRSPGGPFSTVLPYGSGLELGGRRAPMYAGSSADGSQSLFESPVALAPAAIQGKPNVYLWEKDTNRLTLVSRMNDGASPAQGAFAGPYDWSSQARKSPRTDRGGPSSFYDTADADVISADGAYAYFTEAGGGRLYVRVNPTAPQSRMNGEECTESLKACTYLVSATHKTNGEGEGGGTRPAAFVQASEDGTAALFTSEEKLTNDANTGPESPAASIARAALDGSGKALAFLPAHAKGLTVAGEYLYWADPEDGTIGRAKLDDEGNLEGGPEPEFIPKEEVEAQVEVEAGVFEGIADPQYVAVDDGHLYWTNATDGKKEHGTIGRVGIEGEDPEPEFVTGATNPQGIAADPEYLYWANAGEEVATRTIGRAKKADGSEVNQGFIQVDAGSQEWTPQGIALDATHIYMKIKGTYENGYVFRYDIDGDPASRVLLPLGHEVEVAGLAIDSVYAYWSQNRTDSIGRMALVDFDQPGLGGHNCEATPGCEPEFIKEAGHPLGIAVDAAGHLLWAANQGSPPNSGNDLYRFRAPGTGGCAEPGGCLSDLTPDTVDPDGAEVVGVLGASVDLSTVYLAANGTEVGGASAPQAGDCEGTSSAAFINFSGHCNLFAVHMGGGAAYLGRLSAADDALDWLPLEGNAQAQRTARVSPDGQTLLFRSTEQLTAYDNEDVPELYRYRAGAGIDCVSCAPTGAPPQGKPVLGSIEFVALTPSSEPALRLTRFLTADGNRVFFESTDRLVGPDVNGEGGCPLDSTSAGGSYRCQDVYEWEAPGEGSCIETSSAYSPQDGGCLYLLSTGSEKNASFLVDASASGDDAFIITRSELAGQDGDQLYDVYDARVDGGLAAQNPSAPVGCEGEACKGAANVAPRGPSPTTSFFQGPGNVKPRNAKPKPRRCPKGKVARKVKGRKGKARVRCVRRHPHRKHPHRRAHRHHRRAH